MICFCDGYDTEIYMVEIIKPLKNMENMRIIRILEEDAIDFLPA